MRWIVIKFLIVRDTLLFIISNTNIHSALDCSRYITAQYIVRKVYSSSIESIKQAKHRASR